MTFTVNALKLLHISWKYPSKNVFSNQNLEEFFHVRFSKYPEISCRQARLFSRLDRPRKNDRNIRKETYRGSLLFLHSLRIENNSFLRKRYRENFIYRSRGRRDATPGQFSLFQSHVFIPGAFWPTFAEFMSWKDKGLRSGKRAEGCGG